MHLLIFDPHDRGHYLQYIRYLLREATVATKVTLVLRAGASVSLEPELGMLPSVAVDESIGADSYKQGPELVADFRAAWDRHRPDHIWVPSGDLLAKHCNALMARGRWRLPAGTEAECGLIELRFHRPPRRLRGHLRHFFDRACLSLGPWSRLHTIDPTVAAWCQRQSGGLAGRMQLVPDPLDSFPSISRTDARRSLGIPEDGRYVVAAGLHAIPRKGSELLLEAFSRATMGDRDRLLLAGPLGDRLRVRLANEFSTLVQSGRVVTLDGYLQHTDLMLALAAADLVCTPYIDHMGSSAIALQAAQIDRPVLAPRQGWFGDVVPLLGLGYVDNILDTDSLSAALTRYLAMAGSFRATEAARRLVAYSSASNFARAWAVRLRERMSLPPAQFKSWNWVVGSRA